MSLRVVLVRGLAREAAHWGGFVAELSGRLPDTTIECVDLAGNGDQHDRASSTSTRALADDLRARILARDGRQPLLIAISLGAMVGLTWLFAHPRELVGLVTINTSGGRLSPPWRRLRPTGLRETLGAMLEIDPLERELKILELTTRTHQRDVALALRHAEIHVRRPVARVNVVRQLVAAGRFRIGNLPRDMAPVLVLSSRRDRMVDPRCSRQLAGLLDAETHEHPSAGHDIPIDDPRWCAEGIASWFERRVTKA